MFTHAFFRSLLATSVTVAITFSAPAAADGISAGTLIENTATATYDDGTGPRTVNSNTVTVRVDELLNVTVTSLNSGPIAAQPGQSVLTFEVTNQGNGPEAFELLANPAIAGNDFDTVIESIAIDTNGNGSYDPGIDSILSSPEVTAVLSADETVTVFVIVTVPAGAADAQESRIELTARAVTGTGAPGTSFSGQGEGGGDAIVGTSGAAATATGALVAGITSVNLVKSVSIVDPFGGNSAVPGSVATFTIAANVTGSGSIDNFVVSDAIPQGTTYAAGTLALDAASLTDATGDDAGAASDVAGISVNLGTISGGTTRSITFNVTLD